MTTEEKKLRIQLMSNLQNLIVEKLCSFWGQKNITFIKEQYSGHAFLFVNKKKGKQIEISNDDRKDILAFFEKHFYKYNIGETTDNNRILFAFSKVLIRSMPYIIENIKKQTI